MFKVNSNFAGINFFFEIDKCMPCAMVIFNWNKIVANGKICIENKVIEENVIKKQSDGIISNFIRTETYILHRVNRWHYLPCLVCSCARHNNFASFQ